MGQAKSGFMNPVAVKELSRDFFIPDLPIHDSLNIKIKMKKEGTRMMITANAFFQEENNGNVVESMRASIHVDSVTPVSDERAMAIAGNLFQNMARTVEKRGGE